jgi:hypothetical protein
MRRTLLLLIVCFLAGTVRAQDSDAEPSVSKASASLEAGVESAQRRYIRPRLRFEFPLRPARIYADLDYYHRTNGDLEGEIDFWMGLGLISPLSSNIELEAALRHFCRHMTSRDYPDVLDINELTARLWYASGGLRLGFGGGTYLGTSNHYNGLFLLNLVWPRILRSEFSAAVEVKWVDLKEVYYEFELAAALDPSVDLVARLTRHYAYPRTTYFGLRFHSRDASEKNLDQFRFRAGVLPDDETRKVSAAVEFNLHFFKTSRTQLLLNLNGDIPVERGETFLGSFRPEEIKYRADVTYERLVSPGLYVFGFGRYDLDMPVDTAERFDSSLGLGVGLRNQTYFKKLDRNFRYVLYADRNYSHDYDFGVSLGLNTVGKSLNIGADLQAEFRPGQSHTHGEVFVEAGSTPKIRPFLSLERESAQTEGRTLTRFMFGIDFTTWH